MSSILRKLKHPGKADKIETSLMMRNGGILLEKLIESSKGKYNPIRSFSVEDVKTATNNFNIQNIITTYDFHELYKGFLHDRTVSVMKYKDNCSEAHECCINNIVFAAQMCHKNTLKLIGCCFETETPILVFESVRYGSLYNRFRDDGHPTGFEPLLWTHRLKIAMEIANVVAYLHVGFSRPIVFRDIKSSNILFNEDHSAKLFDCSLCISIPEDETYVTDLVVGTFGYLAPEYLASSYCDEKCDVYSFGRLLLELLMGKSMFSYFRSARNATVEEWQSPENHVMNHIENNRFKDVIDPTIVGYGLSHDKEQQLLSFADLAIKCTSESPENRPTMVDVAKQIRQLYLSCNPC